MSAETKTRLSGYDCDVVKRVAIEAGLPVIDSRTVAFDLVAMLAVKGPLIAVNATPNRRPWHALSYAPLEAVAAAYRQAGAEVFNVEHVPEHEAAFAGAPPAPVGDLFDYWLNHVRAHGACASWMNHEIDANAKGAGTPSSTQEEARP